MQQEKNSRSRSNDSGSRLNPCQEHECNHQEHQPRGGGPGDSQRGQRRNSWTTTQIFASNQHFVIGIAMNEVLACPS